MLSAPLAKQTPNIPLFGICSGSPQSLMPHLYSHIDVDVPLQNTAANAAINTCG